MLDSPKIGESVMVRSDGGGGNSYGRISKIKKDRVCVSFNHWNREDTWQWYDLQRFSYKRDNSWYSWVL